MPEIQSLARGLIILEKLANAPDGLGITEVADEFGIDKGSISRLLSTLAHYGYAEKDPSTRRYLIGPQVVRLSRAALARMPLRETAKIYLDQLVKLTGECAHLAILAQGQALYIDQAESPMALRVNSEIGTIAPLYCTALGKVLLAFANGPFPVELTGFTMRTITDPNLLRMHIEQVRSLGYAIDDEEYSYGVRCIAVPVYDFRDKCIAAIGISGPSNRVPLEDIPRLAQDVIETVKPLSARLSFKSE